MKLRGLGGIVQVSITERTPRHMTEHHDTTSSPTAGRPGRTGAIIRTLAALSAGIVAGATSRDFGLGITTATATLGLLREVFNHPAP